jgi:hypothetical protein
LRVRLGERSILAIGYVLFLVWAFPGFMSTDSQVQLLEARSGKYSDAHPPLMSAYWRLLDAFISGPILMLLLQSTLFLGGLYVIMKRVLSPKGAAIAASAILLFPPVMTTMAVIWKDSQMAGFLVAGAACLYFFCSSGAPACGGGSERRSSRARSCSRSSRCSRSPRS